MIALVPTTDEHVLALSTNLSKDALAECVALGVSPLRALQGSVENSLIAMTMLLDDKPAAVFGVAHAPAPMPPTAGLVWLLPSPAIDEHPLLFVRESRKVMRAFLATFEMLVARIDARLERTIRWAKWLGFTIGEPIRYSAELPVMLVPVFMRRPDAQRAAVH